MAISHSGDRKCLNELLPGAVLVEGYTDGEFLRIGGLAMTICFVECFRDGNRRLGSMTPSTILLFGYNWDVSLSLGMYGLGMLMDGAFGYNLSGEMDPTMGNLDASTREPTFISNYYSCRHRRARPTPLVKRAQ
jgi:hypothetical protein